MNIFEQFSIAREVEIVEGQTTLDKQRILMFPVDFISLYLLKINKNVEQSKMLYNHVKSGMIEYSKPLGKDYGLTYRDFLDRWVKYSAFGGWGLVEYKLVDKDNGYGYLIVKNLPMHNYLKNNHVASPNDVIYEALVAGSLSGTFDKDIDVIETECICSGSEACVFYWGSAEYLKDKFHDIAIKIL